MNRRVVYTWACALLVTASTEVACRRVGAISSAQLSMKVHDIPIRIEQQLPTVDVEIGKQLIPLMFDLGDARALSLSPSWLSDVPVRMTERVVTAFDAMGNVLSSREFVVQRLRFSGVDGFVAGEVLGYEDIPDPSYPSPNPNGAVGRAVLGEYALVVDYPGSRLRLIAKDTAASIEAKARCFEIEVRDFGVTSKLRTSAGERTFLWDTGAQFSILQGEASDGSAETLMVEIGGQSYDVQFARSPFEQPPVDGYLGYNFFAQHVVYINVHSGCLIVDPDPSTFG